MKKKDMKLMLLVAIIVIVVWLLIKFISSVPFWVWLLVIGIVAYLNWAKIRNMLS
ncbi:hypothetical protein HYV80_07055 [Candidatus Woesearchaeota archaeon]|nr:hypothetical protein [Candidatus Woesearchaeota archaeon]